MSIKIILAFGNLLFSEGINSILEKEKDFSIKILGPDSKYDLDKVRSLNPDVILTDFTTLYNSFPEADDRKFHFILLDTNCGKDNLVSAILKKKISGVLLGNSDSTLLRKAIRAVSKGEVWIDKHTFKNLLTGINAITSDKTALLSNREREIVALIGNGFRNKEIAHKLHISEPTVKSHLNRVFHKLNVRTRSELVSYAIKNNEVSGFSGQEGPKTKTL